VTGAYALRVATSRTGDGLYDAEIYISVVGLATQALAISAAQALGLQRAADSTITAQTVTGPAYAADNVPATNLGGPGGWFRVANALNGTVSAEIYANGSGFTTQAAAIAAVQAKMQSFASGSPTILGGIVLQGMAG
jgi:hypothetical protein